MATQTEEGSKQPLVSVVTPFYNTEAYLAECIESVLAQTYANWEYVLVNNLSTDASRSICERYARKDRRIRLLDNVQHVGQVDNFEGGLKQISPRSKYCKMVLADDWIFPECLERMVEVAESHPTVGIVSAYRLFGKEVLGDGLPYPSTVVPGREAARIIIKCDGYYLTGSPTTILVRADLVRQFDRFYPGAWIHEDIESCLRILADHDLGFVHQVLSFSRTNEDSVLSSFHGINPGLLRRFLFARQYGPQFLKTNEQQEHLQRVTEDYGSFLASSLFEFRDKKFWEFHRQGLQSAGCSFADVGLTKYALLELLDLIFNPKKTVGRYFRLVKARRERSWETSHDKH